VLPYWLHLVLYIIVFATAAACFSCNLSARLRALRVPRSCDTRGHVGERVTGVLKFVAGQWRLLHGDFPAGLMHFFIFWGFVMVALNGALFLVNGFLQHGEWYPPLMGRESVLDSAYIFLRDVFELLVLLAVSYGFWRRLVIKPKRLKLSSEGLLILALISVLMITSMLLDGTGVALGRFSAHPLSFVERILGAAFSHASYTVSQVVHGVSWWLHLLTFMLFLNLLPLTKHFHVLTSVFKVYLRNLGSMGELPKVNLEDEGVEEFGVSRIQQLTWSNWLDSYSCTECGRCDYYCPANQTGKLLSPQKIITGTRDQIYHRLPQLLASLAKAKAAAAGQAGEAAAAASTAVAEPPALVGEVHPDQALWACTTCGGCDTHCPLFIEHVTPIVEMRRHLVLEQEGRFPKELTPLFRGLESQGNPWGIAAHQRNEWAEGLDVPTLVDNPEAEYIYFVGCMASFDERNKAAARALVQLLKQAGVSFALLDSETCCGDPARRCGHEYLAQSLIEVNAEQFKQAKARKVVTACPHCFNTLKHEYAQFSVHFEAVLHHSELLSQLIAQGKLQLPAPAAAGRYYTVVYHDSCYLGRYNEIYHQPRGVLQDALNATGAHLAEAAFSHDKGYCCGAGGGQMFMEETEGERVNHWRYLQLTATGAESIAVACPFCMTMIDDASKDSGTAAKPVHDIAVLLWDAIRAQP